MGLLTRRDVAVVIPSVRAERGADLVENILSDTNLDPDQIYVHWDSYEEGHRLAFPRDINFTTRRELEQADRWDCFSTGDAACRIYGFARAVQAGAKAILTVDDDCASHEWHAWLQGHMSNLQGKLTEDKWFSTTKGMTRGMPFGGTERSQVAHLSHGLWFGHQDPSAVHALAGVDNGGHKEGFIPRDVFYPMCGMNLAFRAELLPAMYFPVMGNGSRYARFDDIWAGLISKVVMDHFGYRVYSGEPKVTHHGASDRWVNLEKETPGIIAHETVWHEFESARRRIKCSATLTVYGATFQLMGALKDSNYQTVRDIGLQLEGWLRWLREEKIA